MEVPGFHMCMRSAWRPLALVVALALAAGSGPAAAQPDTAVPLDPCESVLTLADERYVDGDFASVESLVSDCVYRPSAPADQVQRGYRLLALSLLRQDQLVDAQLAVVKLLGVGYDYEPDPAFDPPAYVSLVASVKEQLRVDAEPADTVRTAAAVQPVAPRPLADRSAEREGKVSVNAATAAELEAVPGIGPVLASRIVAYREANGPFRDVEGLIEVSGIGPRTLERLAPHLTVEMGPLVVRAGGGVPAAETSPPPPAGSLVNLNTASAAELDTLYGIGPALAARIIEYREANGPFRRPEDVQAVRGIGPKKFAGFADAVTVE